MALAAGLGDIELVDRRLLIVGRKNLMRAVAICADRSLLRSLLDGESMHALLIGDERLVALPARFHQKLLSMAPTARRRDIVVAHRRFGVIGSQNLVRASVAILAICRLRPARLVDF